MSKLKEIRNTFLTGLLIILPLLTTIYVIYWSFKTLDGLLEPFISKAVGFYIPGLSLLILSLAIFIFGIFGRMTIGNRIINLIENLLMKIPVVRMIYSATKEASKAILISETENIKGIVLVEYPRKGLYAIGFTTGGEIKEASNKVGKKLVNVFVPTSPNPTSGFVILIPEDEVVYLDMKTEEALRVIISGGFAKV